MGKFSTQDKVCILHFCALMWTFGTAEQLFFPMSSNATWDEARSQCQACFKDLVTLTPDNIQIIVQNLSSDYWVGLRKNFTLMGNSSVFWTRWANGDPLTFQNWLPGQPVLKSRLPKTDCCSCSCTCPAKPTLASFTTRYTTPAYNHSQTPTETDRNRATNSRQSRGDSTGVTSQSFTRNNQTTAQNQTAPVMTTVPPVAAECVRTPVELPDDGYIEDACVVMLSFGAWVEKNCSDLLPYICYDDIFDGKAQVTDITATTAAVTWDRGPGNITHYRVEVRIGKQTGQKSGSTADAMATNVTANFTTTSLSHQLQNLTAGSHYSVQVFAVKCDRDLNPQNATFYTIPHRVKNLNVSHVTDTSISLSWEKPYGNVNFYVIKSLSLTKPREVKKEEVTIDNLEPGNPYTFSVFSGVKEEESKLSNESSISSYTKPAKVSNLRVSDNDDNSMLLEWDLLAGNASGFRILVSWNGTQHDSLNVGKNTRQRRVDELPSGTKITLGVRAVADNGLLGDESTVVNHTAPQMASDPVLNTTATTLEATWEYPEGLDYSFDVELWLNNERVQTKETNDTSEHFDTLKSAANYSVYLYSVSGHRRSRPAKAWKFTLPEKPVDVKATNPTKNQITIEWKQPENAGTSVYHVRLTSDFWGQTRSSSVNKTSLTFKNLTSGTRYNFEVRAKAGDLESEAVLLSQCTHTDEREVTLSMMCSSEKSLHCDQDGTKDEVFVQLKSHFKELLEDNVAWTLEKLERADT